MNLKEHIEKFDELHPESVEIDYTEKLFAPVEKLETDIQDRDKIIQNLKKDITELKNQISIIEKEKSVISEELKKSGWLENKVTLSSKYKGKFKTILGEIKVVDSKIIPILTTVGRKKQGNQQLNWVNWLKIPENKYLFHVNDGIAKGIFEETNTLIKRRFEDENPPRGGKQGHSLTFSGNGAGAGKTYVSTDFNPDTYNLNLGCTVSYWVRPDEIAATRHALGRRAGSSDERFFFGIHNTRISIGVGSNATNSASVVHTMDVGNWYHWVITYQGHSSGRARKIYMDGELLYTGTVAWGTTGNTGGGENVYFGGRNNNGNFVKAWAIGLDEVAIYDEEKDAGWVSNVYIDRTKYNHTGETGLVGYWRFNKGKGTRVEDLSGKGNHGTLTSTDESTYGLPNWSKDTP